MDLKYRGVSYSTNPVHVKVAGKGNKVMFRGCSYSMPGVLLNLHIESAENITYRGVKTGQTYEAKFMGHTYKKDVICLQPMYV